MSYSTEKKVGQSFLCIEKCAIPSVVPELFPSFLPAFLVVTLGFRTIIRCMEEARIMLIRLHTHYTILNQGFSGGHKRFFLLYFLFLLGLLFVIACLLYFALLCFVVCDLLVVGVPTTYFHVCEYQLSLLINCGTSAMRFRHVGVEISCLNQSWITKKLFHTTRTHPAVCPFLEGKIFFFRLFFGFLQLLASCQPN